MALICVYLLPVLLISVLIPRIYVSSAILGQNFKNIDGNKTNPLNFKQEASSVTDIPSVRYRHPTFKRHSQQKKSKGRVPHDDASTAFLDMTEKDKEDTPEKKPAVVSCPNCLNNKTLEKKQKIEAFKQKLLQSLGLSSPPKIKDKLSPLPSEFYAGEEFVVNDDPIVQETQHAARTKQIFVFGKDITHRCSQKKGTGCYSFDLTTTTIDPDQLDSVELWIYKQPDVNDHHIQTFMVSELESVSKNGKDVLRIRNIVKRVETRVKYGWMKVYVRRSVSRWLSKPKRNQGLAVVCKTCQRQNHKGIYGNKEGYLPILVFYMKQNQPIHQRKKRHTDCNEGEGRCCRKEPLVFNFQEQGWDYIMAPAEININYCTGSCNGYAAAYHNHTTMMQRLKQNVANTESQVQVCCSPVSFGPPQSLLYRDRTGVVRNVMVPDLVVTDCGCT